MKAGSIHVRPSGEAWVVVYADGREDTLPTHGDALNVAQLFGRLEGIAVVVDGPPPSIGDPPGTR